MQVANVQNVVVDYEKQYENEYGEESEVVDLTVMQYLKKADYKMPVAKRVQKNEGYYTKRMEIYNGTDVERY
jgi:hypothetical protein